MNIVLLALLPLLSSSLDLRGCSRPLGMSTGAIKDFQITASSSHDHLEVGPQQARLGLETLGGAWCPLGYTDESRKNWIEVKFNENTVISAIKTQGRYAEGTGNEYPPMYSVEYWRPGLHNWTRYQSSRDSDVILGNSDTSTAVERILNGSIIVRKIRILPLSTTSRSVCMRFELYGCPYRDDVDSYSSPKGSQADGLSLLDNTYDGFISNLTLSGGLGKLYDGSTAADNFEEHPEKWVGWTKEEHPEFVPITFKFSKKQNISEVRIHTTNQFRLHAAQFNKVIVSFSRDGTTYSPRETVVYTKKDVTFETSRWIDVHIPHRIAKTIQIKLFYDVESSWILVSEVKFRVNGTVMGVDRIDEETISHHISETNIPHGNFWIFYVMTAAFISASAFLCLVCLIRRRDRRVKASSPSPTIYNGRKMDTMTTLNGTISFRPTQSSYEMTFDNMQNAMLEDASEYAEPEISHPLLASFYNEQSSSSTSESNPLSSTVKYSDYGEVCTTTLPEIDRTKLEFVRRLGQGEFGEVHLCLLEGRQVAVKRLHSSSEDDDMAFRREIRVLGTLKHPNVVEVIAVSSISKPLLCVMEYMTNGDLKTYMQAHPEISSDTCLSICTQLAAGLSYLESCNYVHRDIAARNCLVDDEGNVKIADFGMARSLYSDEYYKVSNKHCSLPIRWLAPEALLLNKFSTSSDVWSFGITMWEIFNRCIYRPFHDIPDQRLVVFIQNKLNHGDIYHDLPCPPLCPPPIYHQLMTRCWHVVASQRPSFELLHRNLQKYVLTRSISMD